MKCSECESMIGTSGYGLTIDGSADGVLFCSSQCLDLYRQTTPTQMDRIEAKLDKLIGVWDGTVWDSKIEKRGQ